MYAAALCMAVAHAPGIARALDPEEMEEIAIEQRLDAALPMDAVFRDDHGEWVRLGDYFGRRPVILVLGYYECPMLCTLTGNGLVGALSGMNPVAGEAFDIVWISIDPGETSAMAAIKKESYFRHYGRGSEEGWHFLTGDESETRRVADAVGFGYRYDPAIDEYAHASGIFVLTPEGRVSKVLLGINYSAEKLQRAIADAADTRIGSLSERLLLLCYHFSPITGKYGWLIVWIVRGFAAATVIVLGGAVVYFVRRERREEPA